MSGLIGETHYLVLDGRTVSWADSVYPARIYWRKMDIIHYYLVGLGVCVADVAIHLVFDISAVGKRERCDIVIAVLNFKL